MRKKFKTQRRIYHRNRNALLKLTVLSLNTREIAQRTINTDENYNIQGPEYNAGVPDNIPNTALNINDISLTEQQLSERPSNDDQIESDIAEGDESKSDVDDDLSSLEDISSLQPNVGDVFVVSVLCSRKNSYS